ncbi:Mur ligase family protein [Patescibacteria group bacterium]
MNVRKYFEGKKITVMGLGLLGRGLGDAKFLAEQGADLIVTDLRSEDVLKKSVDELKHFPNVKFVLGEHRLEDFRDRDMILKLASVPLESVYIDEARNNNIAVEMSDSLLAKISRAKVVGVTGTRGKSTVTHLIYEILKEAGSKCLLGGNVRGLSTLALFDEIDEDTVLVMELSSWQLQGFGDSKISPYISVFTNFLDDHLNYYKGDRQNYFLDKVNILKYQNEKGFLIMSKQALLSLYILTPLTSFKNSNLPETGLKFSTDFLINF